MKKTALGEPFQTVSLRLWLGEVDERSGSLAPSNARGKLTESRSSLAVMVE